MVNGAYHMEFPAHILLDNHPICHLEALNAVAALTAWAPSFRGKLIHLFCDNATAAMVFQAGKGSDTPFQAYLCQL